MQSYDLTLAAETDLRGIWRYTYKTRGLEQAEKYFDQIEACCEAVGGGRAGSKALDGLQEGVHLYRRMLRVHHQGAIKLLHRS
jgi:toxin ParE1/3/4